MKKIVIVFLCGILFLTFWGCGNQPIQNGSSESSNPNLVLNERITKSLFDSTQEITGAAPAVDIFDSDSKKSVSIVLNSTLDYSGIGGFIRDICTVIPDFDFRDDIDMLTIEVKDSDLNPVFHFITSDFSSGTFIDFRSGDANGKKVASLDDLSEYFPALDVENNPESISDEDMKIYNEVWAALDAEPTRPEDKIFSELAPRYNMTGEELKKFVNDIMFQIYS